jgi:hypothetical protein
MAFDEGIGPQRRRPTCGGGGMVAWNRKQHLSFLWGRTDLFTLT